MTKNELKIIARILKIKSQRIGFGPHKNHISAEGKLECRAMRKLANQGHVMILSDGIRSYQNGSMYSKTYQEQCIKAVIVG